MSDEHCRSSGFDSMSRRELLAWTIGALVSLGLVAAGLAWLYVTRRP